MNAVDIDQAIFRLSQEPFDADGFPFAFLERNRVKFILATDGGELEAGVAKA